MEADRKVGGKAPSKCNPNPEIRRITRKPKHPGEKSKDLLPANLRKHFNAYWQICLALGCDQCVDTGQLKLIEIQEPDEEEEEAEA